MRPDIDTYYLAMCKVVALRATCIRRQVGCIGVNEKGYVISTAYNAVGIGAVHCIDSPCAGANYPSGQGLSLCQAEHAENLMIRKCHNINDLYSCYVTCSPCINCLRLLLKTNCQRIVFIEEYPHKESRILWQQSNRDWVQISV